MGLGERSGDEGLEEGAEGVLLVGLEGGQGGVGGEAVEDLGAAPVSGVGEDDLLGAAVGGVGAAFDEALLLEAVDDEGGVGGFADHAVGEFAGGDGFGEFAEGDDLGRGEVEVVGGGAGVGVEALDEAVGEFADVAVELDVGGGLAHGMSVARWFEL